MPTAMMNRSSLNDSGRKKNYIREKRERQQAATLVLLLRSEAGRVMLRAAVRYIHFTW